MSVYSRFNPDNQYEVTCFFEGQTKVVDCFKFNDKFHTNKNMTVNEQYITNSIPKLTDKNK